MQAMGLQQFKCNASSALPFSPRGRGRVAMTYGRVRLANRMHNTESADVSHSAELVRGDFSYGAQGPLIRPFGAPSPQGEKGHDVFRGVK
jgi:hypothetical protein